MLMWCLYTLSSTLSNIFRVSITPTLPKIRAKESKTSQTDQLSSIVRGGRELGGVSTSHESFP